MAKVKTSKKPKAKPKPKPKRPEEPLHKHPQVIRAQWVGQAEQAWYLVMSKEGRALGWTPTKLLEAMNSLGIVHSSWTTHHRRSCRPKNGLTGLSQDAQGHGHRFLRVRKSAVFERGFRHPQLI